MRHMNEWMSHVTSHVTFTWHDSSKHTNGSWGIWMSHVIFICEMWHEAKNGVGGHMNESRGIWMSNIIFILHMRHVNGVCTQLRRVCNVCVTHEWVMAYAICDIWMIYVHSLVMRAMYATHMNKLCTQRIHASCHMSHVAFGCVMSYGVATISRLLKMIGLFCKRALQKRRYSAKET